MIKNFPEPPPGLKAEKVNGSAEAYKFLYLPDDLLGLSNYAATLAFAAKTGMDTFQAATPTRKSRVNFRAFSLYSLVTVAVTFLALLTLLLEAAAI